MSPDSALWLSEADVVSLIDLREAIDAIEHGLRLEARGEACNMTKTHVAWGGGHTLHAIGALFSTAGVAGTKTWTHTAGGATPLLILFDSQTGALRAIIEAFALGQLRTGGISGVATRWLARADADELAIIGTGKQALAQVAAVAAVRSLRRVRVFSPNPAHRAEFVARVHSELNLEAIEAASIAEAVAGAAIITLVTRATAPFLTAAMVADGCHLNAVGAITPERAEFASDILPRCTVVAVDSPPAAQKLSREFMDYFNAGDWRRVAPLSSIVAEQRKRPRDADLTLFKAMGMGIADLALGIEVYDRARRANVGRHIAQPRRAQPRLH
ncbi:MAG: ornithine cyclodeaminase family protein [Deltaproteobacteria bacterium]|nr:ornithine cyclodeaminase family protein [Deltaproteobacteria bacterium]MBI3386486.1 ornithine cyclodeaminase family protein [Deltaproteobacteria bacterium]